MLEPEGRNSIMEIERNGQLKVQYFICLSGFVIA